MIAYFFLEKKGMIRPLQHTAIFTELTRHNLVKKFGSLIDNKIFGISRLILAYLNSTCIGMKNIVLNR